MVFAPEIFYTIHPSWKNHDATPAGWGLLSKMTQDDNRVQFARCSVVIVRVVVCAEWLRWLPPDAASSPCSAHPGLWQCTAALAQQLLLHLLYCNFAFWNHSVTYIDVCLDLFIKMVGSGYPVFQVFSLTSLGLGNNSYTHKPDFIELFGNLKMFTIAMLFTIRRFWLKYKWVEQWKKLQIVHYLDVPYLKVWLYCFC